MTKQIQLRFLLLIAAIMFSAHQMSYAQVWVPGNFGGAGDIGYTNNINPNFNITGIGIGTFTTNISAALHVNTNLTATNSGFNAGEVFRTDGPAVSSYWRMYSNATECLPPMPVRVLRIVLVPFMFFVVFFHYL